MEELLPVLTTWLEDGPGLTAALRAALDGKVAYLPLEQPPFEQSTHILEVHVVGVESPFLLLADPVGFATNGLFPLQVRPLDDEQRARLADAYDFAEQSVERKSSLPPAPPLAQVARAPKSQGDPLVGQSLASGKFKIEQLLGSGAVGRVYRAYHRDLQKGVAVKVLHPFYEAERDYAARFQGEALAASRIDHPNVVRILDFGQEPSGMLYIVMEFLEGRDLASLIAAEGPLPLERIVSIASQVCAALSVAHDAGIVHRDVKPENVLLVPGRDDEGSAIDVAKVCDFGIAQTRAMAGADRVICGTPEYMSPEQWQTIDLDARSDVYAMGVTLYEMATKHVPFTGQNADEIFMKVLTREAPPPSLHNPDVDPRLQAIVMKCLAGERDARYASARELRAELRALVEPLDGEARLQRRRELLDASALTPLDDPKTNFPEFFIAFASAVMRIGYYDKSHREAATALARLAESIDGVLKNRGELSFARRDVADAIMFTVVTGAGEVKELKKLLPPSVYDLYGEKLGDVFSRRNVVSLALRDGVDEAEIADLVELLSGPEIPAEELRQKFLARGFTCVSVLFVADLLGRKRKLAWQVDLCISRLARDLQALPFVRGMGVDQLRLLRGQMIGDVLRAVGKPDQVLTLLENTDLIQAETSQHEESADLDVRAAIVDALSIRSVTALARQLLDDIEAEGKPRPAGSSMSLRPVRVDPKEILTLVVSRFTRERVTDSDDVLRKLYDKRYLALRDLPADLQMWIQAEDNATTLAAQPEAALAAFDAIADPEAYEREAAVLEFTTRVLVRREKVDAVVTVLRHFKGHASDARRAPRMRQRAAAAARVIEEPEVLKRVAQTYLVGPAQTREAAQWLLAGTGARAAAPLVEARFELSGTDATPRSRFVALFRDIGPPGLGALADRLATFSDATDAPLVEDLLRALPDVADENAGRAVQRFVSHPAAAVRRAAATALAALAGPAARAALFDLLSTKDDGVRLGALAGLRRIRAIDLEVVTRLDKIVGGLAGAGEEMRAAAAAALPECAPEARAMALGILSRVVKPARKSFVGALKDALSTPPESTLLLVASARSLAALGGEKGREIVRERAAQASGVLKQQLEAIVSGAPQS